MSGINSEDKAFAAWARVLNDVAAERAKQDLQHGGPTHDDHHGVDDWMSYIAYQGARLASDCHEVHTIREFNIVSRARLIKIAALAIAACQSIDRLKEKNNAA